MVLEYIIIKIRLYCGNDMKWNYITRNALLHALSILEAILNFNTTTDIYSHCGLTINTIKAILLKSWSKKADLKAYLKSYYLSNKILIFMSLFKKYLISKACRSRSDQCFANAGYRSFKYIVLKVYACLYNMMI